MTIRIMVVVVTLAVKRALKYAKLWGKIVQTKDTPTQDTQGTQSHLVGNRDFVRKEVLALRWHGVRRHKVALHLGA